MISTKEKHNGGVQTLQMIRKNNGKSAKPPSDRNFIISLLTPAIVLFIVIIMFPLIIGIFISFTNSSAAVGYFGTKMSLLNYYEILFYEGIEADRFWQYTYQTLFFSVVSVLLEFLLGLVFALLLNQKFKGRSIARATLLIPWALPTIASATIFRAEILAPADQFGLINNLLILMGLNPVSFYGVDANILFNVPILFPVSPYFDWLPITQTMFTAITVDVWKTTPFFTLLILAALQIVPEDLHKAAQIDGATSWQKFRHIIWPLIKPGVGFALIFRVIDALRVYGAIVVFRDRSVQSMTTLAVQYWINTNEYGKASAVTVALSIIILIAAIIILRVTQTREKEQKEDKNKNNLEKKAKKRRRFSSTRKSENPIKITSQSNPIGLSDEKKKKFKEIEVENALGLKKPTKSKIKEMSQMKMEQNEIDSISLSKIHWINRLRIIKKIIFFIMIIVLCFFCASPFVWIVLRSFREPYIDPTGFELLPSLWSIESYIIIFENSDIYGVTFDRALLNGFLLSGMTVIVVLIISSFVAFIMAKYEIKYKSLITLLLFSMTSLPPLIVAIPFYIQTITIGNLIPALDLRDNILGLVLPYAAFNLPLSTFVLQSFFAEIPNDLMKAAKVDGASNFQIFRKVILPLALPGIFTVAILVFIASWNELLFAQIWLTSDENHTVPRAILRFLQSELSLSQDWNPNLVLLAATTIATVPLVITVLIFQKKIISGITSGAVKG